MDLKNKKVALYGGSFNPIHIGHLITGFELIEKLNYDIVLYIPANIPSHKLLHEGAASEDRLEMVKLSIQNIINFAVTDIEIKRGGISFTIDTVLQLIQDFDYKNKFGIVFGDDLLSGLDTWKDIDRLTDISDLICLNRNHKQNMKSKYKVTLLDNKIIDLSSTEIRNRIKNNLPVDFMLPESVKKYIFKNSLYKD